MTLTLTWACDEGVCRATASKDASNPTFLQLPKDWSYRPDGEGFHYGCPRHPATSASRAQRVEDGRD